MECEDCTPLHAQAIKMKKFELEGKLSEDVIFSIMVEEKPNQVEQFKIPRKKIAKYFPIGTPKEKNGRYHCESIGVLLQTTEGKE